MNVELGQKAKRGRKPLAAKALIRMELPSEEVPEPEARPYKRAFFTSLYFVLILTFYSYFVCILTFYLILFVFLLFI